MSKKVLWAVIIVLLSVMIGFTYKFIVLGNTKVAEDGRIQVLLSTSERAQVLAEMRQLLAATQQVIEGLSEHDMAKIAAAATEVGMQATSTMDITLKAKLPLEFKQLGFATHQAFDDIAQLAKNNNDTALIQVKLATTMNQCLACHSSFQLPQRAL